AGWGPGGLEACVGTNHSGTLPVSGRVSPLVCVRPASVMLALALRRGSTKKPSGAAPLLVIFTGTVTGVPATSFVPGLSGSPEALTLTSLNLMLPGNGSETSSPAPGPGKAPRRVQ